MNAYNLFKKSKKSKEDFIIMMSISSLPFLFYIYDFIPETRVWNTALFELDAGFYEDTKHLFWYLFVKGFTLLILSLWYLSCSQKWRTVLLFAIVAEISKIIYLIKSVNQDLGNEFFIIETIIYSFPYILFLLFISNKKSNGKNKKFNEEINNEIANLSNFSTKDYKNIKKELIQIIKNKNSITKREYLIKLIALRDRFHC